MEAGMEEMMRHLRGLTERVRRTRKSEPLPGIARLMILRYLVRGRCETDLIRKDGYSSNTLAADIGLDPCDDGDDFDPKAQRRKLRELHAKAEKNARSAGRIPVLEANLQALSGVVSLSPIARDILGVAVMAKTLPALGQLAHLIGDLRSAQLHEVLAIMLDVDVSLIRSELSRDSALQRSGLLTVDQSDGYSLASKMDLVTQDFPDAVMSEVTSPLELLGGAVVRSPEPQLTLSDFDHMPLVKIAAELIRAAVHGGTRTVGCNVLIHGAAGLGKTQSSRVIAQAAEVEAFEVMSSIAGNRLVDGKDRLKCLHAAQRMLADQPAVIIADEAEDVFTLRTLRSVTDTVSKAHLNDLLEYNKVPVVYLTNRVEDLEPSTLRRFSVCIEARPLNTDRRRDLIRAAAADYVDDPLIENIVRQTGASTAIVSKAADVVRLIGGGDAPAERRRKFTEVLSGLLSPGQRAPVVLENRVTDIDLSKLVDFRYLNASIDLAVIAESVGRHGRGTILLSGPPGAGKSQFGKELAKRLNVPLQIELPSDILDPYIGGSEARLAAAFKRAAGSAGGTVLQFDECDTYLTSRKSAEMTRTWERSLVNEFLLQAEAFGAGGGTLILTTNDPDSLDESLARRMDFKVRLSAMTGEQSVELLRAYCEFLQLHEPDAASVDKIFRMRGLVPGDYAAVAKQTRSLPIASAQEFVTRLQNELSYKKDTDAKPRMGFLCD